MIESVKSVIEGYRKDGRINATAAYYALGHIDHEDARVEPLNLHSRYMIDAFMFANLEIGWLLRAKPDYKVYWSVCSQCLNKAREFLEGSGIKCQFSPKDERMVSDYIIECILLNRNSPNYHGETFNQRVTCLAEKAGVSSEACVDASTWGPFEHPCAFIAGPSDKDILTWLQGV